MRRWIKLPLGFLIDGKRFRRTAWSIKIGPFRFVEWPWNGFEIQWGNKALVRQYTKGADQLKKWYIRHG